ncbi:uncharacterized protein LOC108137256 [Drosophila elegans]|uniref:uncharacterized protein LOC108137256 n=1 Tax=Drosophila elegans TaxID=30023 RepID=UPI0007E8642D|nr:uncharacterized protein LOC108137256 [Drosophila elegans]
MDGSKVGFLARLDRLLRRWLPGYNFIRNRRRSPSQITIAGGSCSGSGGHNIQVPRGKRGGRKGKQEVYLDTGIAKSEFCTQLEILLRNKLIKKQQEEMAALEQQE